MDSMTKTPSTDLDIPSGLTPAARVLATQIASFLRKAGVEHNDGIQVFRAPTGETNFEGKEPTLIIQYSGVFTGMDGVGPHFSLDHDSSCWGQCQAPKVAYERITAMSDFGMKLGFVFDEFDSRSVFAFRSQS